MPIHPDEQNIYIVITQTGTLPSRFLKWFTKKQYNHVSISLDPNLSVMFSFARLHPYNPFIGGFVMESARFGTFKRFPHTKAIVLRIGVEKNVYNALQLRLNEMYASRKRYRYNWSGLFAAALHKCVKKENQYYCSEFVRDLIVEFGIAERADFSDIVQPMDFLETFSKKEIFRGELRAFAQETFPIKNRNAI